MRTRILSGRPLEPCGTAAAADRAAGVADVSNYPPAIVGTFRVAKGTGTSGESFVLGFAAEKR